MGWQDYLDTHQQRFIAELKDFLRIPSVSAKSEHLADVARAGEWVADRLRRIGVENVALMPTEGHPVVYGDWLHAPGRPTVLIYGHFDVQPAEPFDLWTTPPFEPDERDGRIYARGATDDKAGMLMPILAAEALMAQTGGLPVNVKFFFEGQEEIGSPHLPPFIRENRALLQADMIFSADGGQWSATEPQLITGLKGIATLEIAVDGAAVDLHSGRYGGAVANPIEALSRIIASMKGTDGRITVAGFYDDVVDLTVEDRAQIARVPYDEDAYIAELGADALFGEEGYTTRERAWARPTLEINGITGGWQGEGTKTVLPARATAKISCRLVANQTPEAILAALESHIAAHTPPGVKVTTTPSLSRADPFLVPQGHNAGAIAAEVLTDLYGVAPYVTRAGGSIPVMSLFLKELGVHGTIFAFGLPDENAHSPDEFCRLEEFRRGQDAYALLLIRLGQD